ncbi:MAG: radical SAM protein, partial [Ignavibacteriales bacterium]|nr:radical SAM protein [Ignavibacteriales bacterium]
MKPTTIIRRLSKNLPHLFRREPCFLLNEVFLTYHCTQRCLQCIIPQKAEAMAAMSFEHFKTIVDRLDDYGAHGIILSGGEPLLHPHLFECLDYVAGKNFSYVHILSTLYASRTTVEKLVDAILRHKIAITCSFDGFDETGDYLRGAKDVARTLMENIA